MKKNIPLSHTETLLCLTHRIESIANKYVFQPMGFSAISMKILELLKIHKTLTASDLIKMLTATKSNISQRLNFLEKEKLIIKEYASDKKDKRKILIALTPKGKEMISNLEKRFRKAQISFEEKFSPEELKSHKEFMEKINTIIDNSEHELAKIFKY